MRGTWPGGQEATVLRLRLVDTCAWHVATAGEPVDAGRGPGDAGAATVAAEPLTVNTLHPHYLAQPRYQRTVEPGSPRPERLRFTGALG